MNGSCILLFILAVLIYKVIMNKRKLKRELSEIDNVIDGFGG